MTDADKSVFYAWMDEYRETSHPWDYDEGYERLAMAAWLAACAYCRHKEEAV